MATRKGAAAAAQPLDQAVPQQGSDASAADAPSSDAGAGPGPSAQSGVKGRILATGPYGVINDVVELSPEAMAQAVSCGQVDPHPDAVAYAESLKKGVANA